MHYMLQFYENPEERSEAPPIPPRVDRLFFAGWSAFIRHACRISGAMVSGNGLLPPDTANTLRVTNGTATGSSMAPFTDNS